MDDVRRRVLKCFQIVFPSLSEEHARHASQANLPEWDSVAAITLVNVIEDEFGFEMDLDAISDLESFDKVADHVERKMETAHL